ncbi:MAG: magnesium chelatase [Ignavibacteriaceae bacterium]
MNKDSISTLGELKKSGYKPVSIKDELRINLIKSLKNGERPFEGILGYDETVIPDIQTAILSRHNIILLGLRGQAKTKIARLMINLLDEYIPVIEGSELNDDPLHPLSRTAKDLIKENGDNTKIKWLHRSERYAEKLATPDVSVADLIGDVDPIKAASLKLPYSDERVIHFGLIPRSHRSIFEINELPDPHYPKSIEISKEITHQEANLAEEQNNSVNVDELLKDLIEQVAFEARQSEYIDAKSGVSARLTISAYENLISTAERRMISNNEDKSYSRISDLYGIIPSITGKIELVYEGEQEGPSKVAHILIGKSIKNLFTEYFPSPEKIKKEGSPNPYQKITNWFSKGNIVDLFTNISNEEYESTLKSVPGLQDLVKKYFPKEDSKRQLLFMEFALHGLAEYSLLSKFKLEEGTQFKDMLSSMFSMSSDEDDESDIDLGFYQ